MVTSESTASASEMLSTKLCNQCCQEKPLEAFHKHKNGRRSTCKLCRKAHGRIYYENNKERINTQTKSYVENNKEKVRSRQKVYRLTHKEQRKEDNKKRAKSPKRIASIKAWKRANRYKINLQKRQRRLANNEAVRQKERVYYAKNRDRILKTLTEWRKNNPESSREAAKRYARRHPEKVAAMQRRRRRRELLAPGLGLSDIQWLIMQQIYNNRCVYCGKKGLLTQDHITPFVKGGADSLENIVPACKSCNSKKRDRAPLCPIQPLLPLF